MYIYIYICICIHTYIHTYIHMYVCIHTYIHIYIYIYTYTIYIYIHKYVYIMHMYMYISICVSHHIMLSYFILYYAYSVAYCSLVYYDIFYLLGYTKLYAPGGRFSVGQFGKGQWGSALMGSLRILCFVRQRDLLGTPVNPLVLPTLIFPKVPGRTFFPNLSTLIVCAAA